MPSPLRQHTWLPMSLLATHTRDLAASSDHRLGRIGTRLDCGLPEQNNKLKIGVVLAFWLSTMVQQKTREPGRSSGFFSCGEDFGEPRRLFRTCRFSTSHPQHVSHRITDSPWHPVSPSGSRLQCHGYCCRFWDSHASVTIQGRLEAPNDHSSLVGRGKRH